MNSGHPAVQDAAYWEIGPLVLLLRSSSKPNVLRAAADQLSLLAGDSSDAAKRNAAIIPQKFGIEALVGLLPHASQDVAAAAAGALHSLSGITNWRGPELQEAISAAGGVTALVRLLPGASDEGLRNAVGALRNLAAGDGDIQVKILEAGGWEALVPLLARSSVRNEAADAVLNLLMSAQSNSRVYAALQLGPGRMRLLEEHLKGLDRAAAQHSSLQTLISMAAAFQQPGQPEGSGYEVAQRAAQQGMAQLSLGAAASRSARPAALVPAPASVPALTAGGDIVKEEQVSEVWRDRPFCLSS